MNASHALVRDPLRDQALLAHSYRSRADLFGFTEYMIMCSKVLRAVDIDDGPELVATGTVNDLFEIFIEFRITEQNFNAYFDLVWNPFRNLALDLIEVFARQYAGTRVPAIHWLWEDAILPKVYNLLRLSWPNTRLTREQMTFVASELKEAIYFRAWPNSYFESAEVCMICRDICITTKHKMNCGHWGCDECIMRWLKDHNSCPFCRGLIFWDLERRTQ
ncbi:hypothetical protein JTE90_016324 [Oedothorax gibbosus]|uniref:RING-type domain-containing protein n=1 Tax=Oedothorax gibbosus TaxID=931172 RepID=A0AAV6TPD3_9ARAC|nr:hypothetical protein JTE90_016324 [Oedothorax gibbosus]